MTDDIRYAYVASTSRSGSTLLSMLMNAHPNVASIGELGPAYGQYAEIIRKEGYPCSCGMEIKQCVFWKKIKDHCFKAGMDIDLHNFNILLGIGLGGVVNKAIFGTPKRFPFIKSIRDSILWQIPVFRSFIKQRMYRILTITRSVLSVTGKEVFFDVSKDPVRAFYLAKIGDCDFKLIHLVRDVRGVVNSFRKNNSWGDNTLSIVANMWKITHQEILRLKSFLPDEAYLLVHYERLCNNPMEALSEICLFLGIEPTNLEEAVNKAPHHILGNIMRLRKLNGIRIDDEWKKNLTPKEIGECLDIAGDVGKVLGYR